MKSTLCSILIGMFVNSAIASVPNCDAPLLQKNYREGFNTVIQYYPSGNCDYLGIASSNMQCREDAERKAYSCYQVANREFYGRYLVVTPKCFACIK